MSLSSNANELIDLITVNINKIKQNVEKLDLIVQKIGTSAEDSSIQGDVHQIIQHSQSLSKATNAQLKKFVNLSNDNSTLKIQRERLMNEFGGALNKLKEAEKNASAKAIAKVKQVEMEDQYLNVSDDSNPFSSAPNIQQQQQHEHNLAELRERQQFVRQLEEDISDVNQIFTDLARLVHEQGDMVDSIEANVESAQIHVEQGGTNVGQALVYQQKARQKQFLLLVFFGLLIFIILLTLYFST
uniref:t-SNARE coiled-coil homology domain-containing protein n=1 Tax=Rhabditophanes sp. KR3021 TaxID=114890 RepID=A0AC35UBT9_9BILA